MDWGGTTSGEDKFMVEGDIVGGEFCKGGGDVKRKVLEERRNRGVREGLFFDEGWDVGGELWVRLGFRFWIGGGGGDEFG